jgi:GR25 family glycosyltransferase involved in LPS biosynthesis
LPTVAKCALSLPFKWDAINLENRKDRCIKSAFAKIGTVGFYASPNLSAGSAGYLYSRDGAERVLATLKRFRHAFDTHMGFFWKYQLAILCASPAVVTQDRDVSTISSAKRFDRYDLSWSQWLRWRAERIEHECRKWIAAYLICARYHRYRIPRQ